MTFGCACRVLIVGVRRSCISTTELLPSASTLPDIKIPSNRHDAPLLLLLVRPLCRSHGDSEKRAFLLITVICEKEYRSILREQRHRAKGAPWVSRPLVSRCDRISGPSDRGAYSTFVRGRGVGPGCVRMWPWSVVCHVRPGILPEVTSRLATSAQWGQFHDKRTMSWSRRCRASKGLRRMLQTSEWMAFPPIQCGSCLHFLREVCSME